jgi:predicted 3-demethylubiquinone-9 3-methyltransferase (glyoxalase superfamily)
MMDKIVPHLWYDKEAREAAEFYISLFDDSEMLDSRIIEDTPSGDAEAVSFRLAGQRFEAISGGPIFQFNPSVSLMVACYSKEEVNAKWEALSDGGTALMPLDEYDFNKWYGWVQDRYGLSWQLMLMDEEQVNQKITPCLLFSDEACGKAEEAMRFYAEIFPDSSVGFISRYENQEGITPKAKINYGAFTLSEMNLVAMDNGYDVDFSFNEALSFIVYCKDQQEIDYFWNKLSAVQEAEECGWIKDQFGLSWQILPVVFLEMLKEGNGEKYQRMVQALLKMKKLDVEALQKAYDGE